jgi:iron complex outermembrane receptor protein
VNIKRLGSLRVPTNVMAGIAMLGAAVPFHAPMAAESEAESTAASDRGALQEIIVTARREQESLQSVPITVTAFSSESLEMIAPKTLFDMTMLTPSLNYQEINPGRGGSRIQMRGVTGGNTGTSRASVFLDGVYIVGSMNNIPFQYLERIEVMPGPQSAQFGRSTFAGAINYITRDPGTTFSGTVDMNYGSLGEEELYLEVGGPISERVRGNLYGWHQAYDPGWRSVQGAKIGTTLTRAFGGKLIFDVTDDLTIELRGSYSQDWDDVSLAQWLDPTLYNPDSPWLIQFERGDGTTGLWFSGVTPAIPFDPKNASRSVNPNATEIRERRNDIRGSVQVDYDINGYLLSFTGGHFRERYTPAQRGALLTQMTFIDNPNYALDQMNNWYTVSSAELRLSSPRDRRLRYSLGLFYQELGTESQGFTYNANVCLSLCTLDILGTYSVGSGITRTDNENITYNRSIIGSISYDFTDKLTGTFEARYQQEDVESTNRVTGLYIEGRWNSFLPRVSLNYHLNDEVMLYAVYSVGNNPGVFNTSQFVGQPGTGTTLSQRQAGEERLINYELGLKSMLFDHRLMINAVVYHQLWKDMQFPQLYYTPTAGSTFNVVENRGSSEVNGVEFESQWMVTPNFSLRATISYNKGKYVNFCSGNFAQLLVRSDVPPPNFCIYVNGNRLENVPGLTRTLFANYSRSLVGDWEWFARGSWQYQSGMYTEEWNWSSSPSATIYTANLGLKKGPLTVEVYCRNCSDEDSPARIGRSTDTRLGPLRKDNFAIGYLFRRPRQYGLHVNYNF